MSDDFADPPTGYKRKFWECPICYEYSPLPNHILNEDFCICDSCMNKGETDDEIKFRIEELILWAI
jgi:hypothetical protein